MRIYRGDDTKYVYAVQLTDNLSPIASSTHGSMTRQPYATDRAASDMVPGHADCLGRLDLLVRSLLNLQGVPR